MPRIQGSVVVIAGASSGIGRATAQHLARQGAHLVLASRRADTLEVVRGECERLGAEAIAVPTDVTDAAAVRALADAARARFGRIDVWINNAGVGVVGPFDEVPIEEHEQTIRTNLLGQVNGAYAALPVFKRQGSGVLINLLSIGSWVPTPFAASYAASKAGLRGFTESLRAELQDQPSIHVCDVFPSVVDTPGLRHGANRTGQKIEVGGPITSPFEVAEAVASLIRRPRDSAVVGVAAWASRLAATVAPKPLRWAVGVVMKRGLSGGGGAKAEGSAGNLFTAPEDHAVYGGFRTEPAIKIPTKAWMAAAGIIGFWLARRR
ncbi:SDR family oxidoreductase [Roseomonas populi]|uniref:SDR family oxidoreductase n=1 Tax=Roseomonas populi TaxID=3121582 RepID=A0ABT1XD25_9PROT|nr:SDR family oxidoreductase [Roseomonas pecuniae]MCR0985629.1 SDR family oxidoreductase [Roseomonas pecuniae]